jgi:hypothetical protein
MRVVVASVLVLAAALSASGVIAGQFRSADPEAFHEALTSRKVVKVADIAAADGHSSRGVFAQETDIGQLCVWDAPSATSLQRGGGCNSVDDPLGGSAVSASLAYDGGPGIENVRDARLIGLADDRVASVVVLMSDGSERAVRLKATKLGAGDFLAFGYRVRKADLRAGIGPVAVIARDADGEELARQPTGIG